MRGDPSAGGAPHCGRVPLRLPFQIPLEHLAIDVADLHLPEVTDDVILDAVFSCFCCRFLPLVSAVGDVRLVDQFGECPTPLYGLHRFHALASTEKGTSDKGAYGIANADS